MAADDICALANRALSHSRARPAGKAEFILHGNRRHS
jgi:hypothetical protein